MTKIATLADHRDEFERRLVIVANWMALRRAPVDLATIERFARDYDEASPVETRRQFRRIVADRGRVRAADEARRYLAQAGDGWREALVASRWRRAS